jgi:hypothetical protein
MAGHVRQGLVWLSPLPAFFQVQIAAESASLHTPFPDWERRAGAQNLKSSVAPITRGGASVVRTPCEFLVAKTV